MKGAPVAPIIETIRPGVQFTPPAAASFRRAEADLGRPIDVNSTYRDPVLQLRMYNAWLAYIQGRGPHPGHSRALHPDDSVHCKGEALDSDDWRTPGFNTFMAERGWIRTAAGDPTEQHHFEYQVWRDQHRNRPSSDGSSTPFDPEEDSIMSAKLDEIWQRWLPGKEGVKSAGDVYLLFADVVKRVRSLAADSAKGVWATTVSRGGAKVSALQELADAKTYGVSANEKLDQLLKRPVATVEITDAMAKKIGQEVALAVAPKILDAMAARLKE